MQEKKEEDLQQALNKVFEVGIDEVGRGAIFGPVFAAAVVLNEKNIITVDLTNEEKIVFSQLGINPLIKLGKEYLTSNNIVRLKESNKEPEKHLDNKKTKSKQIKKISKSGEEKIQVKIEANANSKEKSTNKTNESNEVLFTDKNDENELTDELNNARKKRRRSSASIE